jgi:hypothetical protein
MIYLRLLIDPYLRLVTECSITLHAKAIQHRAQGSNPHGQELHYRQVLVD